MSRPADADLIAAIATAQGRGGIGVVRISGKHLASLAASILGRVPSPRRATRANFLDRNGHAIDDGIAVYYPAPASYTGEDVLELQGHGGPVVLQMLLRRSLELGARLAEPGEFTRRAFLNDKLDLAQAEGVADLIDAATEVAARCALRSLKGEFSAVIDALVQQLIELRMLVEATLDFPEEEIDPLDRRSARERLARLRAEIDQALSRGRRGSVLRSGLQVVLAGAPNVGKSSLLNRLAGEELAIVTEIPGTTRDTVRQTIQIEGVPINVIDTAGLRETSDRIEAIGISRTWDAIGKADALLLVVDAADGITERDRDIIARLPNKLARVVVFNKIDLTGGEPRIVQSAGETDLWVSARSGAGLDYLRNTLLVLAGWRATGEDMFMARERHLVALGAAADCLARAEAVIDRTELFAEELRLAQAELSSIVGAFTADDLLGEIFSRFCIGK
ncbi:MAG: tRNA uridine-5-carboxymethylaminomethyl(34) synthesis GTPase MnmE [Betaproteobacteria bacterium]|nr:tRNA uridine-5-carboxymethylaminomethyl(34) synthesis GTPase MnmE [Betaproteobacteria bacterium]